MINADAESSKTGNIKKSKDGINTHSLLGTVFTALIFVFVAVAIISAIILYRTRFQMTDIAVIHGEDNSRIVLRQVGKPDYKSGNVKGKILLYRGGEEITNYDFEFWNDGYGLDDSICDVMWHEDRVEIAITNVLLSPRIFVLSYDGSVIWFDSIEEESEESSIIEANDSEEDNNDSSQVDDENNKRKIQAGFATIFAYMIEQNYFELHKYYYEQLGFDKDSQVGRLSLDFEYTVRGTLYAGVYSVNYPVKEGYVCFYQTLQFNGFTEDGYMEYVWQEEKIYNEESLRNEMIVLGSFTLDADGKNISYIEAAEGMNNIMDNSESN